VPICFHSVTYVLIPHLCFNIILNNFVNTIHHTKQIRIFLISNFRRDLNVVFFLLGYYPTSEFYVPTFRNIVVHIYMSCEQDENGRDRVLLNSFRNIIFL